jgi:hypothetical protein
MESFIQISEAAMDGDMECHSASGVRVAQSENSVLMDVGQLVNLDGRRSPYPPANGKIPHSWLLMYSCEFLL